jgi:RNA polymerase subunit RPABC4/transcription elongation factor Spt4
MSVETRYLERTRAVQNGTTTPEIAFGNIDDWIINVGNDHELFFIPVVAKWFYHDRIHKSWNPTGYGPGEVVFFVADGTLAVVKRSNADKLALVRSKVRQDELPQKGLVCEKCQQPVVRPAKFCPNCGSELRSPVIPISKDRHKCSRCSALLKSSDKFCGTCGAPVSPAPSPPASLSPQQPVCPKCRQTLKSGAKFCGACGARIL